MKRITLSFLFAILFMAVKAEGQKIGFVYEGQPVSDDTTFVFDAVADMWSLGKLQCSTGSLAVKNYSESDASATFSISQDGSNTLGTEPEVCLGGSCRNITLPYSGSFTAHVSNTALLEYKLFPQTYGSLKSRFTISALGESHTIYILFRNQDPTGVKRIDTAQGLSTVYDLQGHLLLENAAPSQLEGLKSGIYVVRSAEGAVRKVIKK